MKKRKSNKWIDVTDLFNEEERHYKDSYLEIDEVYNEEVEVSLFFFTPRAI